MSELIDEKGMVTRWPKKHAEKERVLDHLIVNFETGRVYRKSEVNDVLNAHHTFADWALLRRELYDRKYFDRDPKTQTYWRLDRQVN